MLSEYIYRGLTGAESVHLKDYPVVDALADESVLIEQMDMIRTISSVAKSIREEHKLRNRLPLKTMTIAGEKSETLKDFLDVLKDEINVKEVVLNTNISAIADNLISNVTYKVKDMLGLQVADISVYVEGIRRMGKRNRSSKQI